MCMPRAAYTICIQQSVHISLIDKECKRTFPHFLKPLHSPHVHASSGLHNLHAAECPHQPNQQTIQAHVPPLFQTPQFITCTCLEWLTQFACSRAYTPSYNPKQCKRTFLHFLKPLHSPHVHALSGLHNLHAVVHTRQATRQMNARAHVPPLIETLHSPHVHASSGLHNLHAAECPHQPNRQTIQAHVPPLF